MEGGGLGKPPHGSFPSRSSKSQTAWRYSHGVRSRSPDGLKAVGRGGLFANGWEIDFRRVVEIFERVFADLVPDGADDVVGG